jgi:hypothetical protein
MVAKDKLTSLPPPNKEKKCFNSSEKYRKKNMKKVSHRSGYLPRKEQYKEINSGTKRTERKSKAKTNDNL